MISPLDDPSTQIALNIVMNNLTNGHVGDLEKLVLSTAPLPNAFIDGFISQSVEVKTMMDHAYNALSLWIEEAKKANYFHKHFTDLSRMINSGVQSMARGLVTLHALGEDLNQAPMSIDDLINVGSYHFNKSYLGVLQTSAKDPETGFRLLTNQFSWQNTLLRLFRTKEKLEKGAGSLGLGTRGRFQVSGSRCQEVDGRTASEVKVLPDSAKNVEAFEPFGMDEVSAFSGVSGFSAPAAYAQPRAFSAIGVKTQSSPSGNKKENTVSHSEIESEITEKKSERTTKSAERTKKITETNADNSPVNANLERNEKNPENKKSTKNENETSNTETEQSITDNSPDNAVSKSNEENLQHEKIPEINEVNSPENTVSCSDVDNSSEEKKENNQSSSETGQRHPLPQRPSIYSGRNTFIVGRPP